MRYIGNKESLIDNIRHLLIDLNLYKKGLIFFDAFSGTGTVSNSFKDTYKIILNDNLFSSYAYSMGRVNASFCSFEKLGFNPITFLNKNKDTFNGFISKNYAPTSSGRTYFSDYNAGRIDYFRKQIEEWKNKSLIGDNEYFYLISCLLESVSKVANVAGVYGACLKTWDPRSIKEIVFIESSDLNAVSYDNAEGYNNDINDIIDNINCDILYLDPPYTKNKYTTQYHLLETIALSDEPVIKGVTGARNMKNVSSAWSTKNMVEIKFDEVLSKTRAKHVILSYSSDGLMSKEFIIASLKRYGVEDSLVIKEINYKKYRNIKTLSTNDHFEYLFYIKLKDKKDLRFTCPLNYMGGKTQIIEDLIPFFKKNNKFIDLMGGGFNVGINVDAPKIIYNDINFIVKELVKMFKTTDTYRLLSLIDKTIKKHNLQKNDKESFVNYRALWNDKLCEREDKYLYLYVLILFGFQQQLRFNSNLKFNNTVGESGYNELVKEKIISFSRRIKSLDVDFYSMDFEALIDCIDEETTLYVDPPYLITLGSYNDGKRGFKGWSVNDDIRLYSFLDRVMQKGARIVLSNVIYHKDKTNEVLLSWIKRSSLNVKEFCKRGRQEVVITNG